MDNFVNKYHLEKTSMDKCDFSYFIHKIKALLRMHPCLWVADANWKGASNGKLL